MTEYTKARVKEDLEGINCPDLTWELQQYEGDIVDIREEKEDTFVCLTKDNEELIYFKEELYLFTELEAKVMEY